MKRTLTATIAALLMVAVVAGSALAGPTNKLTAFGDTGTVVIDGGTVTITTAATGGEYGTQYGGVYLDWKSQGKKALADVSMSFTATGDITGGAPRFSIPVSDATGAFVTYAFLDRNNCAGAELVSTTSATCAVNAQSIDYANWAAFAAAHPTWKVYTAEIPFIIADVPGTYVITNIDLH